MKKNSFQLWPAIDIINGKPVRLLQGDYSKKTQYDQNFADISKTFSKFAYGIHIVDLDGAKQGQPVNTDAIQEIIQNKGNTVQIEVGGGIRNLHDLEQLFSIGVSRCILGTAAFKDQDFLTKALIRYGADKIVVGVDCKNRKVATHGWKTESTVSDIEFITQLEQQGVTTIQYTDISTDGTLQGSATKIFQELHTKFPHINIIGSGGIATLSDIQAVKDTGITGIIFGKAFYENKITAQQLQRFIQHNDRT